MGIIVKYIDKVINQKLEITFYGFEWFGLWYADNYESVEVIEVIQEDL